MGFVFVTPYAMPYDFGLAAHAGIVGEKLEQVFQLCGIGFRPLLAELFIAK
jgi:hypothetical protein